MLQRLHFLVFCFLFFYLILVTECRISLFRLIIFILMWLYSSWSSSSSSSLLNTFSPGYVFLFFNRRYRLGHWKIFFTLILVAIDSISSPACARILLVLQHNKVPNIFLFFSCHVKKKNVFNHFSNRASSDFTFRLNPMRKSFAQCQRKQKTKRTLI